MPMRKIVWIVVALLVVAAGLAAWVRTTGVPAERHRLSGEMPGIGDHPEAGGFTAVRRAADPAAALARLERAILATPRTERLAGRAEAGEASFVTRSAFWGFPDVTNIRAGADRVETRGHLVLGRSDMGVNRRRVEGWLAAAGLAGAS